MCCNCKRQLILSVGSAALIVWFAVMAGMTQTSGWTPVLTLAALAAGLALYVDANARRSKCSLETLPATEDCSLSSKERRIRRCLRERVGEEAFVSWFNAMRLENSSGSGITVSFPVKFLRDYVRQHFYAELSACCREVFPDRGDIRVVSRSVTLTEH